MKFGKVIKLFLMDGTPNGRWMCELSNWTGIAYKIPRNMVKESENREELSAPGVYFLFGRDDEKDKPLVYIGEAENIIKTCRDLVEKHNGEVPESREALEALAGVGRKTANVVLNTAFGHPTIAVDTHIFRVCNRTNFAPGKDVVKVEEKLLKVVPKEFKVDVHHWLILHGRYTCTARKPRCGACIIEDLCEYKEKTEY